MNVGDKVVMVEEASRTYGLTKEGSEGIVASISQSGQSVKIKFTKLTGEPGYPLPAYIDVDTRLARVVCPIEDILELKKKILSGVL